MPPPIIFQGNSLLSLASPENIKFSTLGTLTQEEDHQIIKYIVKKGDTVWGIAKKFDIDVNTILWANNLSKNSVLKKGQELVILPVSGILHVVEKGDTISEIAEMYEADPEEIMQFNGCYDGKILVGDILIIPGGKKPRIQKITPSHSVSLPKSYFICPIPSPCHITQGLHWYNAVDFSNGKCGEPVYAAARGTVQKAGYQRIAGKYVRILHPNGVVTFYGHLSKVIVFPGQRVSQGQIIGYIGHTGHTIPRGPEGCHLHFDVFGGRNPFAR
jgi:murein DD-endopeptidase MepM/ murein hydrolase activator NlpD